MADTHVISALKAKRAEIAGFIEHLNKELDQARAEIVQIEGSLRIFGYERPASDIPPKKYTAANLFKRNEATKFIFDQLRTAPNGLLTSEIAERYVVSKGWDLRDKQLVYRVKHRLGSVLSKHGRKGELVAGAMHGPARMWHLPFANGSNSLSTGEKPDDPSPE